MYDIKLPVNSRIQPERTGPIDSCKSLTNMSIPRKSGNESRIDITQMQTNDNIVVHSFGLFLFAPVEYTITLYLNQ